MIIIQTPLRIGLAGGGTDLPAFFEQEGGCVISSAIDRYVFVIIKERYDDLIRVGYSTTEIVSRIDELQHELVREALRTTGIERRVEISTMADIPSTGSGLGSSSSVTVGLLSAMYHYLREPRDAESLAREACEIEIARLRKPIGKQDQYTAAYGGLRSFEFRPDGSVSVETLRITRKVRETLEGSLLLFSLNIGRKSESILRHQAENANGSREILRETKRLVAEVRAALENEEPDALGMVLDESWRLKKQLGPSVTNQTIDDAYCAAKRAGALGGKVTGAGGGGHLLLYVPLRRKEAVRTALAGLQELPFKFEDDGTKAIFNYRR